ncbi:MAG: diguanylate cyclase [Planctomycetes bacterium]|nr:diguanylate cyclase [Planctomycetota bacterium]
MKFKFSLQPRSLKYKLWIVYSLLSVIPFLFFLYIIKKIFPQVSLDSSMLISLALGLGAILMMSLASFWLLRRSVVSIEKINRKAHDFFSDTKNEDIKLAAGDEVETMSHYFSEMMIELQAKMKQANDYARDLSEMNKKLARLAIKDSLTNLFNRAYIVNRLEAEFQRAKEFKHSLSVLLIDIDDFKKCNDNYGHLTGDQILQQTAILMNSHHRLIDILARYGGEEFLLIMPEISIAAAKKIAEKIRRSIADYHFTSNSATGSIRVTVSIGGSHYVSGMSKYEDMIQVADQALYEAKRKSKNKVIFK